jgi:hypothetical protein
MKSMTRKLPGCASTSVVYQANPRNSISTEASRTACIGLRITPSERIKKKTRKFVQISDLFGCSFNRKDETSEIFKTTDEALILACYPRTIKLLLENCRIDHLSLKKYEYRERVTICSFIKCTQPTLKKGRSYIG